MSEISPAKHSGFRDITIPADAVQEGLILLMLICLGVVIGVLIAWPVAGESTIGLIITRPLVGEE